MKIALTFGALIVTEIILGYSITSLYNCDTDFDYKCYHTLTMYQFGIIVTNLLLLCFWVYQSLLNEIINDNDVLNLVHEYIHERSNEDNKTKNNSSESSDDSSGEQFEEPSDAPSNLTKRDVDIDKSINDFNEMIMSLVSDTQSDEHPKDESK